MGVIQTEQWLSESYENPMEICKRLEKYVNNISAKELFHQLTLHGMYRRPTVQKELVLTNFKENNISDIIQGELKYLRRKWQGPDVPIFILPADQEKRQIQRELRGKSGLTFQHNIFLFISEIHDKNELKALFTHEYNHICRLHHGPRDDKEYRLMDAMVLEGMAERAVYERFGKEYNAPWTTYYSKEQLQKMWKNIIFPYRNISTHHRKYEKLMYGTHLYPKYLGYSIGYYLVQNYCQTDGKNSYSLLNEKTEEIIQASLDE